MEDAKIMTTREALRYVRHDLGYETFRIMAKVLTSDGWIMSVSQVHNYYHGKKRMNHRVARHFFDVFGIIISDTWKAKGRPPVPVVKDQESIFNNEI